MSEINLKEMKEALKPFGNVRQCEIMGEEFHLTIIEYKNTMKNFADIGFIISPAVQEYPFLKKMNIDENIFHVIAKKKE